MTELQKKEHSKVAIASFILTMLSIAGIVVMMVVIIIMATQMMISGVNPEQIADEQMAGFVIPVMIGALSVFLFGGIGFILSIISLFQKEKKRTFGRISFAIGLAGIAFMIASNIAAN